MKSKELLLLLSKLGYKNFFSKRNSVKFIQQNSLDFRLIRDEIKKFYRVHYQNIVFKNIEIHSRGYINSLPKKYIVTINKKNSLRSDAILSIKSLKTKKQLFFNYKIEADVDVFISKDIIQRKEELSKKNCIKQTIHFDKFRALPIKKIGKRYIQSKHKIKKNSIITQRDIQKFNLIKRGSNINVILRNRNINISFSATALQNGTLGEIINVKPNNSKILKIRVIGYKLGEVI